VRYKNVFTYLLNSLTISLVLAISRLHRIDFIE